jgi:two-component system, cell cycle response regulator
MARLGRPKAAHRHRIVVIDDDGPLRDSVIQLLASEGHEVRGAATAAAGVELVVAWHPDLVLLDYVLEQASGADVVRDLRRFDRMVQVLLVTGYAAEHPARGLLAELDINGYHDKADGPERLLILVDAALKQFRALASVDKRRRYLRHVIDVLPHVMLVHAAPDLLRLALEQLSRLLEVASGIIATTNSGLLVLSESANSAISVQAATGSYQGAGSLADLPASVAAAVRAGLGPERPAAVDTGLVAIPLSTRDGARGAIVIDSNALPEEAVEACEVFAQQVMLALENVILFDKSTVDPLTGVFNRGFGAERLDQTLRLGDRSGEPTSVVLIDIDHFKSINDTHGHAAGDLTLRAVARAIKAACRTTDVVVRYGGEEFLVVLPATATADAALAAEHIRSAINGLEVEFEGKIIKVTASFGVACSTARRIGHELVKLADRELYRAKRDGRDRVYVHEVAGAAGAQVSA